MFNSSLGYDCMFGKEIQYSGEGHHMRAIFISSSCVKEVRYSTSWESQKHKAQMFPLLLALPPVLPQLLQSINIWDNLPLPPLYQEDSKSSLGCIHCYLIPAVTFPATHSRTSQCQHSTYPACMVASIFHNASCTSVRYGPWFHLCGAMVALLSVPEWNSYASMSLICQSQADWVFTCHRELQ